MTSPDDAEQESGEPLPFDLGWHAPSAEVERLRQRERVLQEALRIYAERRNWFQTTHLQGGDWPVKVWAWDDYREPWSMAEAALAQAEQP